MYELIRGRGPWPYQITRRELEVILNSRESLERALDWRALEAVCSAHELAVLAYVHHLVVVIEVLNAGRLYRHLLAYDPAERGDHAIQSHAWFHSIDWTALQDVSLSRRMIDDDPLDLSLSR